MIDVSKCPGFLVLATTLFIGSGCATSGTTNGWEDPDVLTRSELAKHSHYSAMDVIRQFRPVWLNTRNGDFNGLGIQDIANPRGIRVYFDGINQRTGLSSLRRLLVSEIDEMRKLDSREATQRFGIGHSAGAILVSTRGG